MFYYYRAWSYYWNIVLFTSGIRNGQEGLHLRYFMTTKASSYIVFSPFQFEKLVFHSIEELTAQNSLIWKHCLYFQMFIINRQKHLDTRQMQTIPNVTFSRWIVGWFLFFSCIFEIFSRTLVTTPSDRLFSMCSSK